MGLLSNIFADKVEQWTGLSKGELVEWQERANEISEWRKWQTGEALKERDEEQPADKNGDYPLKYPLQINPVVTAARIHSFALWGEVPDTADPLVRTIVEPDLSEEDQPAESVMTAAKKVARHAERVLSRIHYENKARAMFTDLGLTSQIVGGTVLKVGWEPGNPNLPTGIRLEYFAPEHFHCHWLGTDYWNLPEVWIKYPITPAQAALYGVIVPASDKTALYVEKWTTTDYKITVNGEVAIRRGQRLEGLHNWGFTPFVYIPHERTGGMWGNSIAPDVLELVKELNAREADIGDAVHLGVTSMISAWNIKHGHPQVKYLSTGQPWIDWGRAISQGDPQPGAERLAAPSVPAGTLDFNRSIKAQAQTDLLTPPIAYGEEEGSQRSGETLVQRMWPLLSHTRGERTNWTTGINQYCKYILKILASKQQAGISGEHLNHRMRQKWAPMVPLDRAKLADEVVRRLESNGISIEQAVELFGDAEDNEEEVKRIWAMIERKAEIENQGKVEVAQMQADAAAEQAKTAAENQQVLADKNAEAQAQTAKVQAKAKPQPVKRPGVPT